MIQTTKQLIVIGDSGVYGWGDREGGGWCERLRKFWMNTPGAPIVYSLGIRGDGLEKVSKRWKNEWGTRGELRRHVPDGILLAIGLNDIARIGKDNGRPQLTAEAFRFGLEQLLLEVKEVTTVMVMGLTPVDEKEMPFAEILWYSNNDISIYESQIEEACLEANVPFLPLYNLMIKEPELLRWIEPDGIHLNSDGHEWIFSRVLNWDSLLKWANLTKTESVTPI